MFESQLFNHYLTIPSNSTINLSSYSSSVTFSYRFLYISSYRSMIIVLVCTYPIKDISYNKHINNEV